MSLMYKCDRCGEIYEPHYVKNEPMPEWILKYSPKDSPIIHTEKQLCPECIKSLEEWFENPNRIYCCFTDLCRKQGIAAVIEATATKSEKKRWWQK